MAKVMSNGKWFHRLDHEAYEAALYFMQSIGATFKRCKFLLTFLTRLKFIRNENYSVLS